MQEAVKQEIIEVFGNKVDEISSRELSIMVNEVAGDLWTYLEGLLESRLALHKSKLENKD